MQNNTSECVEIAFQRITRPGQLIGHYTRDDGLGLYQDDVHYYVHDCIIDLSGHGLDDMDEAVAITWGASAVFKRCWIRGAGKLILCGSGDEDKESLEYAKTVLFEDCLLEDFGRRGPEVQGEMCVTLQGCVIRNWGDPSRFSVRNFAVWAHHNGAIDVLHCVFWQDGFWRPLKQMILDLANHIGQAYNDDGILSLFKASTYLPGVCRGVTQNRGIVCCWNCYKNHWWIRLEGNTNAMSKDDADAVIYDRETMVRMLDTTLPTP
ncbi:MAG: hypothetical protein IJU76_05900 [Desulfovibrionaceae bacterium]|nr:hypothetical protein [Desulfovibrionaceae bacterium]